MKLCAASLSNAIVFIPSEGFFICIAKQEISLNDKFLLAPDILKATYSIDRSQFQVFRETCFI